MALIQRLVNLVRANRHARDIDRELTFHVEELADELETRGLSRADALRQARLRFGNRTSIGERTRDVDVLTGLESVLADLRYAFRSLRMSPGFAVVAVLSLALGIGANTAIFSLVNAVMIRALPVAEPERLVKVTRGEAEGDYFTNPLWEQIRDNSTALAGAFAYVTRGYDLTTGGPVRRATGAYVSGDAFAVLGVRPEAGRLLTRADDVRGCPGVAVVSHGFSSRELGGPEAAVGRTISLDGHPFTVVGVVDARFSGMTVGSALDVYTPLCALEIVQNAGYLDRRSTWYLNILGRMKPGTDIAGVRARLAVEATAAFEATVPGAWGADDRRRYLGDGTFGAEPAASGLSDLRTQYGEALVVLMVVVGVVLLVACANVAHLLLARAAAREREVAIRLAIGAGRGRLIRQLLTESLVLSGLGAAAGIAFAYWAAGLLVRFLSGRDPVWLDLTPDGRVLGFTIAAAVVTALLFGLAPAWNATGVDPQSAMKARGRGITAGRSHFALGRSLVVAQVALSLVLVVAAGLLLGSFRHLLTLDAGFARRGVLLVSMDYSRTGFDEARRLAVHRAMLDDLRALPGVTAASAALLTPIGRTSWNEELVVEGYSPATEDDALAWFTGVSTGYLATFRTRLVAGREFTDADRQGGEPVALVNETMARRFFGASNPLGRSYRVKSGDVLRPPVTIVGVVADTRYQRLSEDPFPIVYLPLEQAEWWFPGMNYALRSDLPPAALGGTVTAAAAAVHPNIGLTITTFEEQIAASLTRPRLLALLSGFFGALALLLAMIGLYGTIAYGVARRRAEIGVRLALGAARSRVVGLVLGEAGRLVVLGTVIGIAGALAGARLLKAFLYGLEPSDPFTLAAAAVLLGAAALAAATVPAWRASRLDPMATLREE